MVMLKRKQVILAKIETTYGVDPTPTAGANAILAINPEIKEMKNVIERNINISTLSNKPSLKGKEHLELTFMVEMKGSGVAGTAPRLGTLLQACSMGETVSSSTSVTYAPVSSSQKSVTIYSYIDGVLHKLTGARGTVKITCPAGGLAMLEFSFMGVHNDRSLAAMVTGTYDAPNPPVCKACTFSYNSRTTLISKLVEIDLANTSVPRDSLGAETGIEGFEVTTRKPVAVMDVESQIETSYDFRGDQLETQREIELVIGATAGNIITLNAPKFNITNIEYADSEGILVEKLTGELVVDSGDDELSIEFT